MVVCVMICADGRYLLGEVQHPGVGEESGHGAALHPAGAGRGRVRSGVKS